MLAAFGKTKTLAPGESEKLTLRCDDKCLASYDEQRSRFVMEAGEYRFTANEADAGSFTAAQEITVENNDRREPNLCAQRIAICQLGELEYGIFEVDGGNGSGMKLFQVGEFITREEVFPECKVAFNLDGGGSTNLMLNGKRVHKTLNSRSISGLIYFVSAVVGE